MIRYSLEVGPPSAITPDVPGRAEVYFLGAYFEIDG